MTTRPVRSTVNGSLRFAICCVICCVLAACASNDAQPSATTAQDGAASAGVARADTLIVAPGDSLPFTATVAPAAPVIHLVLDGEGLRFVIESSGSNRLLEFSASAEQVIAAVTAAGGAAQSRGTNADCGAGPVEFVSFENGLSLVMQQAKFVGWSARKTATSATLTTMSGIGVGSTRAALDSSYAAAVSRSTLGTEFSAGELQGVLASASSSAPITDMWAGTSCVAR